MNVFCYAVSMACLHWLSPNLNLKRACSHTSLGSLFIYTCALNSKQPIKSCTEDL